MSKSSHKQKSNASHVSGRAQRRLEEEKRSKQRRYLLAGGGAALAVIVAVALIIVSQTSRADETEENALLPDVVAAAPLEASIPRDGKTLGDPNAPAILTVWADYQCPFCGQFSKTTLPRVIEEYVKAGRLKVEYKEMPLVDTFSGYGESDMAAEAAACAADQGKYWEMHDTIYANQFGENEGAYSKKRLKAMAAAIGLDTEQFNSCFDDRQHKDAIAAEQEQGLELGVSSTPTLFLNGERITWTGKYEDLKAELDRVLA